MDIEAESMFDDIAKDYEATFAHDPSLHRVIDQALKLLKPNSSIIDVGCGTGRPVSHRLAEAGHDVTGIDISQQMLDIASRQVKGQFTKTDMTKYQPEKKFDAIFAIFSLFNISRRQTYSMLFKFSEWLQPGGRLILATIPSDILFQGQPLYGHSGEWVDRKPMYFMGHDFCGSASTIHGWQKLLSQTGFQIETEFSEQFCPPSSAAHKKDPDHLYFIAQKGQKNPLMGPYPLPEKYGGPYTSNSQAQECLQHRSTGWGLEAIPGVLEGFERILCLTSGGKDPNVPCAIRERVQILDVGALNGGRLPFPDKSFNAVIGLAVLDFVDDPSQLLQDMARLVDCQSPKAALVVLQGAPDNEAINLVNRTCDVLPSTKMAINHQGFLLHQAATLFEESGFNDISLGRVSGAYRFPEPDLSVRCQKAAEELACRWHNGNEDLARLKSGLIAVLEDHFADRPYEVGHDMVLLTAKAPLSEKASHN